MKGAKTNSTTLVDVDDNGKQRGADGETTD